MPCRQLYRRLLSAVVAGALVSGGALAQTSARSEWTAATAVTGVYQFDADLEGGGDFGWGALIASGALIRQVTPQFGAGLALRYDYEKWNFSQAAAFGGQAPWDRLNMLSVSLPVDFAFARDFRVGITPLFGWSYETGAGGSNARNYGAVLAATKRFSPQLTLGAGAGIFRQIDETKVFPFLVVQWQINERWRLANPFRAGPAGGAGLELAYAVDDNWEVAGGGAYRSSRFRLDDNGLAPGGIGEHRFFPLFARVARKWGPGTTLELYAGVSAGGRLSVTDTNGDDVASEDYDPALAVGLTLSHRF